MRASVRENVRIVGAVWRGSRNPCATRAIRRAWARRQRRGTPAVSGRTDSAGAGTVTGDVEELLADGVHDRLHPRVQLELLEDVAHVVLHGVLADEQLAAASRLFMPLATSRRTSSSRSVSRGSGTCSRSVRAISLNSSISLTAIDGLISD